MAKRNNHKGTIIGYKFKGDVLVIKWQAKPGQECHTFKHKEGDRAFLFEIEKLRVNHCHIKVIKITNGKDINECNFIDVTWLNENQMLDLANIELFLGRIGCLIPETLNNRPSLERKRMYIV